MSPLAKAKGMKIAILAGGGDPDAEGEDTEAAHSEGGDEESTLGEIAAAAEEKDWQGMAQAIAAYVDACMSRKEG